MKKVIICMLLFSTCCIFAQNSIVSMKMINDLYSYAQYLAEKDLPNEFTIAYNYYQVMRNDFPEKEKLKDIDKYFDETKKTYERTFKTLVISMYDNPQYAIVIPQKPGVSGPVKVSKSSSKSFEIDYFVSEALGKGYTISDFELKGMGPIDKIQVQALPKK
jgi:hypothetical protein